MADESDALLDRLRAYVSSGAHSTGGRDDDFLTSTLKEARALVTTEIGGATSVPAEISDRAIIECASELYQRRAAPQGVTQFAAAGGDGAPVRVSRDPMGGARLILRPYLGLGIG